MNRRILRLAGPNILSNLTVPLLSSVDTALVGHLDKVYYLGAIAVGGMIFNFIYWGFGFLRMGTTGLTAQAFGQENMGESSVLLGRALLVAIFSGILLITLQNLILHISFLLIDSTAQVKEYAQIYFRIRIFAAPATLALYAFTGWFLGMQNARYPLLITVVTNLLNIIFNIVFIKRLNMNVEGVAFGTVCANYLGLILAITLFKKSYMSIFKAVHWKGIFRWSDVKKFFTVSRDIFMRTLILIFAFAFFTAKSAQAGDLMLAANSILINLWTIMSYGIDGFAFAAESLIGRYFGARDRKRLQQAIKYSFIWGAGLGLIFTLVFGLFQEFILRIFTNNNEVISLAITYMIWTVIAPLISSFCYMWDGIFIGATATTAMRNAMLISLAIFYLPVYFLLHDIIGIQALWLALTTFMIARSLTLILAYKKHILNRLNV